MSGTFARATPVFRSSDYVRSRNFFASQLDFTIREEAGDPARFGIFGRDKAVIFVDAWNGPPDPSSRGWNAYIHVEDVAALHAAWQAAGAPISRPLEDTPYGMTDFEVTDPDGNVICFGEETD